MTARDRIVIVVVLIAAALAGSWMLIIQPKRKQAAALATQVASQQSQLDSVRSQLAQGESARQEFARDYAQMVRLGEAVPADDNVPSLIVQLQGAAAGAHVDFRSLQVNTTGSPAPSTAPAPGTPGTAGQSSAASASTLPPGVTVGSAGFPVEQFSFSFQGSFFHLSDFFNRLQQFVSAKNQQISIRGRLMTLNAISLAASPQGFPQIAANVSATAYLLPASQGLVAGATPLGPASAGAGASGSPGASSSPSTPTAAAAVSTPLR